MNFETLAILTTIIKSKILKKMGGGETLDICLLLVIRISTGGQYMVVDCGGGTVDITVHEVSNKEGHIKEVFKATGGPYGSISE